jgi:hypothetical protein
MAKGKKKGRGKGYEERDRGNMVRDARCEEGEESESICMLNTANRIPPTSISPENHAKQKGRRKILALLKYDTTALLLD